MFGPILHGFVSLSAIFEGAGGAGHPDIVMVTVHRGTVMDCLRLATQVARVHAYCDLDVTLAFHLAVGRSPKPTRTGINRPTMAPLAATPGRDRTPTTRTAFKQRDPPELLPSGKQLEGAAG
jgi:hypothetical protein